MTAKGNTAVTARSECMSELCAICQLSFGSPVELLDHREAAHRDADAESTLMTNPEAHRPGLVCGPCAHRFSSPEQLRTHLTRPRRADPRPGRARPAPG
jgi:hypothetical protein